MRQPKYAKRVDSSQSAIVDALRKCGCTVVIIGQPVDLAIHHPTFGAGMFKLLEAKAEGHKRPRRDQEAQEAFLTLTGTPKARTPEEAVWTVLGWQT